MDWLAQVNTLIGAAIGIGATLLTERVRARREGERERAQVHQRLYSDYLMALSRALEALREVQHHEPAASLPGAARLALKESDSYPLRYQLSVIAPATVVARSEDVYRQLRGLRDMVARGETAESAVFRAARSQYGHAFYLLRQSMRTDLTADGTNTAAFDAGVGYPGMASQ